MRGLALTFDDAYIDEWLAASPIFAKYDARVTFFISYVPQMQSHQLVKLHQLANAGHEIGFHSATHANAVTSCGEVGIAGYIQNEILPGIELMNLFGLPPTAFAYPFNARSPEIDAALFPYFRILRGRAMSTHEACHPFSGNRLLRARSCDTICGDGRPLRTVDDVETYLHETEDGVLALYGHGISDQPVPHHFMTALGLDHLLFTAQKLGFKFVTASELA